eukprot:scaffold380_cov272-Pinguiococcus_pyrenoidosus.AAC.2
MEVAYTLSLVNGTLVDGSAVTVGGRGVPGRGGDSSVYFMLGQQSTTGGSSTEDPRGNRPSCLAERGPTRSLRVVYDKRASAGSMGRRTSGSMHRRAPETDGAEYAGTCLWQSGEAHKRTEAHVAPPGLWTGGLEETAHPTRCHADLRHEGPVHQCGILTTIARSPRSRGIWPCGADSKSHAATSKARKAGKGMNEAELFKTKNYNL